MLPWRSRWYSELRPPIAEGIRPRPEPGQGGQCSGKGRGKRQGVVCIGLHFTDTWSRLLAKIPCRSQKRIGGGPGHFFRGTPSITPKNIGLTWHRFVTRESLSFRNLPANLPLREFLCRRSSRRKESMPSSGGISPRQRWITQHTGRVRQLVGGGDT